MRRIHVAIAALVLLALALGFGCMRGWRQQPGETPAPPQAPASAAQKPATPAPPSFDARIDPAPDRLFAAASTPLPAPPAAQAPAPQAIQAQTPPAEAPGAPQTSRPVAAAAPVSPPRQDAAAQKASPPPPSAPAPPEPVETALPGVPTTRSPAPSSPGIAQTAALSPRPGAPRRIMVAGDSFAVGVGLSLAQTLKGSDVALCQYGKTSSGLNSPRFYDWNAALKEFLAREKPDALVIMLGANDAQNGSGSASWSEDFSQKTGQFIEIAEKAGAAVYWVGLPPMRDEALNAKVKAANEAMRKACEAAGNCSFIESWDIFCDPSGAYVRQKKLDGKTVSLRAKDGVHMTMSGYKALGDKILDKCAGKMEISRKDKP